MNAIYHFALVAENVTEKPHSTRKFYYIIVHIKTSLPQLLRLEGHSELLDQGCVIDTSGLC